MRNLGDRACGTKITGCQLGFDRDDRGQGQAWVGGQGFLGSPYRFGWIAIREGPDRPRERERPCGGAGAIWGAVGERLAASFIQSRSQRVCGLPVGADKEGVAFYALRIGGHNLQETLGSWFDQPQVELRPSQL